MRKNRFAAMVLVGLLAFAPSLAYAGVHIKIDSVSKGGIDEINFIRGGTTAQQVGAEFRIPIVSDALIATGTANGGATSMTTAETAVPVSYTFVRKAISVAGQAGTMANGVAGQLLTIWITDRTGSGTFVLTPTTKTGFTSVTFDAIGDMATFLFVDTTIGWVLVSHTAATVTQP